MSYNIYLPVTGQNANRADADDGGSLLVRPRNQPLNARDRRWLVWRNLAVARICRPAGSVWASVRTESPVQWDPSGEVGAAQIVTVLDQRECAPASEDQRERFCVRVAAAAISPELFPALQEYAISLGCAATAEEVSEARYRAKEEVHAASGCGWARESADLALEVLYDDRQRPRRVMDWAAALSPVHFMAIAESILG